MFSLKDTETNVGYTFEDNVALREQYMLGLLLPIRGRGTFKVVVRKTSCFDYSMVNKILNRIGSPTKYYKYYKSGDVHVLEGFTDENEYRLYKKEELRQNVFNAFFFVIAFIVIYLFQRYVFDIQSLLLASFYWFLVLGCAMFVLSLFPDKPKNIVILECDKL